VSSGLPHFCPLSFTARRTRRGASELTQTLRTLAAAPTSASAVTAGKTVPDVTPRHLRRNACNLSSVCSSDFRGLSWPMYPRSARAGERLRHIGRPLHATRLRPAKHFLGQFLLGHHPVPVADQVQVLQQPAGLRFNRDRDPSASTSSRSTSNRPKRMQCSSALFSWRVGGRFIASGDGVRRRA
jgi:hypothetical protein